MSSDARYEDGGDRPLKLKAIDSNDLKVIASLIQDSIVPKPEISWRSKEHRFALLINRFRWEDNLNLTDSERVQSLLIFDDVMKVSSKGINQENILDKVLPKKDVDGFNPINYGKMALGIETFLPATPAGIIELIKRYSIDLKGKKCLVIGRSQIVGRPISILLSQNKIFGNATVTVAHSRSNNLKEICLDSDVIISAIGIPEFIKEDMIKTGSIIIDVGICRVEGDNSLKGYRIVGDVDFESVYDKVSLITPVPGGVGPMTIAMLLKNTLRASTLND